MVAARLPWASTDTNEDQLAEALPPPLPPSFIPFFLFCPLELEIESKVSGMSSKHFTLSYTRASAAVRDKDWRDLHGNWSRGLDPTCASCEIYVTKALLAQGPICQHLGRKVTQRKGHINQGLALSLPVFSSTENTTLL